MKKVFLLSLLILNFLFLPVSQLNADGCRSFSRNQQVFRQNFQQSHYYAPQYAEVYYFVGQPLRIKALVELEQAEEYAEFLQYKLSQRTNQSSNISTENNIPDAARTSLVTQICAKCHSGVTPKAQLTFTSDAFLALDTFKKARDAVLSGEMPKGIKLSSEEKNQVVSELSTLLGE